MVFFVIRKKDLLKTIREIRALHSVKTYFDVSVSNILYGTFLSDGIAQKSSKTMNIKNTLNVLIFARN